MGRMAKLSPTRGSLPDVEALKLPASDLFPPGFVGPLELHDFDAIQSAGPEWDHSNTQLGRGPPKLQAMAAHSPAMELALISRSPGVLIRGAPPRGTTVLAVSLLAPALHCQRLPWEQNAICVVQGGREFEIISPSPHSIFEFCVSRERLEDAVEARWGRRLPASLSGPGLRFRDARSRDRLVEAWFGLLGSARRSPGLLSDSALAWSFEEQVLGAVLDAIEPAVVFPAIRSRRNVALRAERFLRKSLDEPIRIEHVCAAARASRQSLHASFQEAFRTTPRAYWTSLRLSAARRDLQRAKPGTTVAEIAVKWCFFRLGHFSLYYRTMFAEKPSDTLRRALGRSAPAALHHLEA
jgi:AraC family ethanolamine operon transcriptional activator